MNERDYKRLEELRREFKPLKKRSFTLTELKRLLNGEIIIKKIKE